MPNDANSTSLAAASLVAALLGRLKAKGLLNDQEVADVVNDAIRHTATAPHAEAVEATIRSLIVPQA